MNICIRSEECMWKVLCTLSVWIVSLQYCFYVKVGGDNVLTIVTISDRRSKLSLWKYILFLLQCDQYVSVHYIARNVLWRQYGRIIMSNKIPYHIKHLWGALNVIISEASNALECTVTVMCEVYIYSNTNL